MGLSDIGYTIRTPEEMQAAVVNRIKQNVPSFILQPADIQSNFINTTIAGLLEYENIMAELFNSFSGNTNNITLFRQLAESLGLRQLKDFKAQVTLEFSGAYGVFIPKGTKAGNEAGDIFETQEDAVIPTTGKIQLYALSDTENVSNAGEITTLISQLSDGVTVTNPSASFAYIPQETDEELKMRVQARLRSPRKGGVDYAQSILRSLEGVDRRLIKFRSLEVETDMRYSRGIEAIIGGGENDQIALALFLSFLETQKLISNPSNNETERTVQLDLDVYNSVIPIKFTRPKMLELKITFQPSFSGILTTPTALEGLLASKITEHINSMQVGTPLNSVSLNYLVMPLLISSGIKDYNVKSLGWKIEINNVKTDFDPQTGYLKEIAHDCYLVLKEFGVSIIG